MAFKDILVALNSYPEPTPIVAVERAVSIAAALGAHIAALSWEMRVQLPGHFVSTALLSGVIAGETQKSKENAHQLLAAFAAAAEKSGVLHETILEKCVAADVPEIVVEYARLRDLTILPVPVSYDQWQAEAVIFGSGRPVLILPNNPGPRPFDLGTVVVAWDFSRAAARAISAALPILEMSGQVRIVTVLHEKPLKTRLSAEELARNLARNGIDVVLDAVDAGGNTIGRVLESYALSNHADMLVMGAYGHSRLREFVLGGATHSLLSKPPLPILFSH
jgi:nucleotide-binding universal stress UspA family protein